MKIPTPQRLPAAVAAAAALVAAVLTAPVAWAISGGHESPAAYSFLGSLQRPESPRADGHVCGATLIAPRWMVTAGHCVRTDDQALTGYPHDWRVRLGSTSASSGGELIDVEKFIKHPGDLHGNDLALLELKTPAKGAPIEIAGAPAAAGTPARIMGWGMTCDQREPQCFPDHLREADTTVQPATACANAGITETEICVGSLDGSVAATDLDSGGPALVHAGTGWALAGAVSGGNGAGPVVYTSVPAFRTWVADLTADRTPSLDGAADLAGCSGSVVRTDLAKPGDPALLLTNGHCTLGDRPAPGSAVVDRPEARPVTLLGPQNTTKATANTTKLVYATMTGTDIGLYQLDKTYAQLAAAGVKVFELSATAPREADPLDLVSGGLRKTWSCSVGGVVPELREAGYVQHDAIRYTEDCQPDHGASGSPLIDPRTGAVVGIHGTGNDRGEVCTADNPCEADATGTVTVHIRQRYGQQTAAIPACLAAGSEVALAQPGCTLPEPAA